MEIISELKEVRKLVNALCIVSAGWYTKDEEKVLRKAQEIISRNARICQLSQQLDMLKSKYCELKNTEEQTSIETSTCTNKAIFKYNNGRGALLCSECRVILKQGSELSHIDWKCIRGEQELEAQYCDKCKEKNERT